MFETQTVFVIGAGASSELGLPTGIELKDRISRLLDLYFEFGRQVKGDAVIGGGLRQIVREQDDNSGGRAYIEAAHRIREALPQSISIDNFIDAHRDDPNVELMGKLAIARAIIDAERSSKIFVDYNRPYSPAKVKDTWLISLIMMLTEGVPADKVHEIFKNVAFINFNYDRCLEHFLVEALKLYYGLAQDVARRIVGSATIIHPYGTVGRLPWLQGEGASIDFGSDRVGPVELLKIASSLKTFTQQMADEVAESLIQKVVGEARTIVFFWVCLLSAKYEPP